MRTIDKECMGDIAKFAKTGEYTEDFFFAVSEIYESLECRLREIWAVHPRNRSGSELMSFVIEPSGATIVAHASDYHRYPDIFEEYIPYSVILGGDDAISALKRQTESEKKKREDEAFLQMMKRTAAHEKKERETLERLQKKYGNTTKESADEKD